MLMLFLTSFALLQLCPSDVIALALEAEDGVFRGNITMRSAASGGLTVLVQDKQDVLQMFLTASPCEIQVSNVRYSDGSSPDVCTVFVDGENVGEFRTITEQSTGTDRWNEFYNRGTIGSTSLQMGQHLVRVTVNATDEFGVELNFFELSIDCDRATEDSDNSGLSVEQVVGITLGVFFLVFAIISSCVTGCCWCYKN